MTAVNLVMNGMQTIITTCDRSIHIHSALNDICSLPLDMFTYSDTIYHTRV